MKKIFTLPVMLFMIFFGISCSKSDVVIEEDPVIVNAKADFVYKQGDDPFTFEFENLSEKYKRLEWRFGDDSLSTEENPSHVYLTAGTFTVDLRTISETGAVTRKVMDITIVPDSVLKITADKTSNPNQVKYKITTDASIAKVDWTFRDAKTGTQTNSTALDPSVTYSPATLNDVKTRVVTSKGSVVEVNNFVSTAGIIKNFNNMVLRGTPSEEGTNSNELSARLLDGNVDTKLFLGWAANKTWTYTLELASVQTLKFYGIGNANDSPGRDPKTWQFEGSNDGNTWEVLDRQDLTRNFYDQRADAGFQGDDNRYKKMFYYEVANPRPFLYYRYNILANFGDGGMQFSEIRMFR
jgi:PKD repeat protein